MQFYMVTTSPPGRSASYTVTTSPLRRIAFYCGLLFKIDIGRLLDPDSITVSWFGITICQMYLLKC